MDILNENKSDQRPQTATKSILISILVALILLAGIWIWKNLEVQRVKNEAIAEIVSLKKQSKNQMIQSHQEHLKLLVKPFVWAVRTEMIQGNMSQVNLFVADMVKEKNVQKIAISNSKGMIISSTNKKDEGKNFSSIGTSRLLTTNNTTIENQRDSVLIITSPIMGFNNRLGTLLIKYAIPSSELQ